MVQSNMDVVLRVGRLRWAGRRLLSLVHGWQCTAFDTSQGDGVLPHEFALEDANRIGLIVMSENFPRT